MQKPSAFIGSSSEGLDFARAIRSLLADDAEITLWREGFFRSGSTFIETLLNSLKRFDFAILVLTPDDLINSRDTEKFGPRDNVIFELGMFMGFIGRSRTFMVHHAEVKIPSDLLGMVTCKYEWPRKDGSHEAAVGVACDEIRRAIRDLGISETKTSWQIQSIQSRQNTTESKVNTLQIVVKGLVTEFEHDKLVGLAAADPFKVSFHNDMYEELKRLDAIGYVKPNSGYGIISIRERDGSGNQFDLKQYVHITEDGQEYLKLRSELGAS